MVKCLAQEHNTMTRSGLEPGPLDPESSALTTRLSVKKLRQQSRESFGQRHAHVSAQTQKFRSGPNELPEVRVKSWFHAFSGTSLVARNRKFCIHLLSS